jgi:hypothetical protein
VRLNSWHKKFTVIAIWHTISNSKQCQLVAILPTSAITVGSAATQNRTDCQLVPSALGTPAIWQRLAAEIKSSTAAAAAATIIKVPSPSAAFGRGDLGVRALRSEWVKYFRFIAESRSITEAYIKTNQIPPLYRCARNEPSVMEATCSHFAPSREGARG